MQIERSDQLNNLINGHNGDRAESIIEWLSNDDVNDTESGICECGDDTPEGVLEEHLPILATIVDHETVFFCEDEESGNLVWAVGRTETGAVNDLTSCWEDHNSWAELHDK